MPQPKKVEDSETACRSKDKTSTKTFLRYCQLLPRYVEAA